MFARACIAALAIILAAGCGNGCGSPQAPAKSPEPPEKADGFLTVRLEGLRNADGQVLVTVFDGPEGFPSQADKAVARAKVEPTVDTPVSVEFPAVRAGSYAVSVVHDEDSDGELRRNFLGMPTEGYGVSNNPEPGYGAPSWEQARVDLPEEGGQVRVVVRYR